MLRSREEKPRYAAAYRQPSDILAADPLDGSMIALSGGARRMISPANRAVRVNRSSLVARADGFPAVFNLIRAPLWR
jgi:hypothetical protein